MSARLDSCHSFKLTVGPPSDAMTPRWRDGRRTSMQAFRTITSTLFTAVLAVPLLAGCPKLGNKGDADAAAEAGAVPVVTASAASSATVEPSADAKNAPACKGGQTSVNVKGAQGIQSQCQQLCGQGLRECGLTQTCTGSTVVPGQRFCVNIKCKAGEKLVRVAAVMFNCVTVCSADVDCPKQRPSCGREFIEDIDHPGIKFRTCEEASTPAPAATPNAAPEVRLPNPAFNTPEPPAPATKVKCVLPSPPPCASPHVASPKGLCQVPCSNGSCAACGGTCQAGFCVGG